MAVLPFNIPGFNPKVTPPKVIFPAGATDCHAHVFGPQCQFPYLPGAAYIAPDATPQDYANMLTAIGCQRAEKILVDNPARLYGFHGGQN
jgi:predicted TIM-barrel fold metal-dependent hydrolase